MNYIKNSIEEIKKVTWPTKDQAIKLTIITIIFTIIATAILTLSDLVFKEGYLKLLDISNKTQGQTIETTTPDIDLSGAGLTTIDSEGNEASVDLGELNAEE